MIVSISARLATTTRGEESCYQEEHDIDNGWGPGGTVVSSAATAGESVRKII